MEGILGSNSGTTLVFLVLALGLALSFEFVNGFHDTANAVATVIYTNSLRPWVAVVWSGLWNLIGVLISTGVVAFGIVALLPAELVLNVGSGAGFAMVFSLLLSAIVWNLGTWYLGLPASSSHTLIGSIVGVGLANSMLSAGHTFGDGVNWGKVQDTLMTLLVSPVIGFVGAGLFLLVLKVFVKNPEMYAAPAGKKAPPWWIRGLLVLTCTGVSFAHGSNDGQKGMGLMMLILIGVVPGIYALNPDLSDASFAAVRNAGVSVQTSLQKLAGSDPLTLAQANAELSSFIKGGGKQTPQTLPALAVLNGDLVTRFAGKTSVKQVPPESRKDVRSDLYLVSTSLGKLQKAKTIPADVAAAFAGYRTALDPLTQFIPTWVKVAVATFLGLGTMIGWKRIVVTVGEKIGKSHLTYGQGASAELIAMTTIQAASSFGLPVSTTHVLSSGVAGTMAANGSGLQRETMRNIIVAWVLTLPVCVLLGSVLFAFGLRLVASLGSH